MNGERGMRYVSIAWRILWSIAKVAVILALFHLANSRFETILVSALVIIYVDVAIQTMKLGYALHRKWNIDLKRYIALAKALQLNTEIEEAAEKENIQDDDKNEIFY